MKPIRVRRPAPALPAWLPVAAAGLLLFGWKAGMPLTDGDSAFYARIAQNIIETGDWQTLRFKDYALIDKPPLTIWLIAASYLVLGINEAAVRGWHILMSVATLVAIYKTARLFYDARTALLSAWILLTSLLFAYCALVPQQDMPLTFFLAVGMYGLARFLRGDGWRHTYTFWGAAALGVLSRGLQALVLPAAIAAAALFALGKGRIRTLLRPWRRAALHVACGFLLCLLIAAPWFILEYRVHGRIFFDTFFGAGNSRFFDAGETRFDALRFFAYLPLLLVAFLPWSGLLGHALWTAGRHFLGPADEYARPSDSGTYPTAERIGDTLFLLWFVIAFAMPWLIAWRVIRYLLPAVPPLAVLTARYLARYLDERADARLPRAAIGLMGFSGALVLVLAVLLAMAAQVLTLPHELSTFVPTVLPWLVALALALLAFTAASRTGRCRVAVSILISGSLVSLALAFSALHAFTLDVQPWREAASVVNRLAAPDERVVWADGGDNWFLDFYVERGVDRLRALQDYPDAFAGAWVIGTAEGMTAFTETTGLAVDEVWRRGQLRIGRLR